MKKNMQNTEHQLIKGMGKLDKQKQTHKTAEKNKTDELQHSLKVARLHTKEQTKKLREAQKQIKDLQNQVKDLKADNFNLQEDNKLGLRFRKDLQEELRHIKNTQR
ncbi:MAG TPA: hypothetical protein VF411_01845 [Bacteroidia bacterium]